MKLPSGDDLEETANGLARIQKTFNLTMDDFVRGKILDTKTQGLEGREVYDIGSMLYASEQHGAIYDAINWFKTAIPILSDEGDSIYLAKAYRALAGSYAKVSCFSLSFLIFYITIVLIARN